MYQRVGQSAYKADLTATIKLAEFLNNPENNFKSVHVAGTNGKGSTSHMLASIFQEAGYKTGLYTSPHLKDFRERIKINGEMIPEQYVSTFVANHKPYFENNHLSFFEMTVGLAFDYFRNEKVDIAIVEVGMGGRLDSTNIINPEISIITNIGLDHTQFLGNTLALVAAEKAGTIGNLKSDLKGNYQQKNIKTVLGSIEVLQHRGWNISEENIKNGLQNTVKNTGLMGRWQILMESPKVICDTGHNKEGLQMVMAQLSKECFENLHIVLGVVNDKDLNSVLPLFPKNAIYYFCKPNIPRGLEASLLLTRARGFGLVGEEYISVSKAYEAALAAASATDLVFIGGSTFVVAEVL